MTENKIIYYLEIGTLNEREYTGISNVTASYAERMLATDDNYFFYGQTMVDAEVVADILHHRDGEFLDWHVASHLGRPAPFIGNGKHVGIFPNRKTCRRGFDFEVQIIHDLSTLLTPQYHVKDTIEFHATSLEHDIATNDLTVCVSEATRTDVIRYLAPRDPSSVVTILNAAAPARSENPTPAPAVDPARPLILILGTIEPRKNVGQVLELLRDNPAFCNQFRFVFLGRSGWGATVEQLVVEYGLTSALEAESILFPGFVDEGRKHRLMREARLLIYPSLFEGYGLPIVEAMAMGLPCIATRSSSMPEVGGEACFYFDPFTPNDLRNTFVAALAVIAREEEALRQRCRRQAAAFSWDASYAKLQTEISSRLSKAA